MQGGGEDSKWGMLTLQMSHIGYEKKGASK